MQPSDCAARLKLQLKPCTADSGFAARCEESGCALPSQAPPPNIGAQPRVGGLAPNFKGPLTAGHSHRLTSGGKAVARESCTDRKQELVGLPRRYLNNSHTRPQHIPAIKPAKVRPTRSGPH